MYKITIQKIEDVDYVSKEWRKLRDPSKNEKEDKYSEDEDNKNPQYGYVETPASKQVETKLLELTLDELDVMQVTKKILEK